MEEKGEVQERLVAAQNINKESQNDTKELSEAVEDPGAPSERLSAPPISDEGGGTSLNPLESSLPHLSNCDDGGQTDYLHSKDELSSSLPNSTPSESDLQHSSLPQENQLNHTKDIECEANLVSNEKSNLESELIEDKPSDSETNKEINLVTVTEEETQELNKDESMEVDSELEQNTSKDVSEEKAEDIEEMDTETMPESSEAEPAFVDVSEPQPPFETVPMEAKTTEETNEIEEIMEVTDLTNDKEEGNKVEFICAANTDAELEEEHSVPITEDVLEEPMVSHEDIESSETDPIAGPDPCEMKSEELEVPEIIPDKPEEEGGEDDLDSNKATEFVQVNTDNDKEEDKDLEDRREPDQDPIASDDVFEDVGPQGADEELCIVPDMDKDLSQNEAEATEETTNTETPKTDPLTSSSSQIVVSNYQGDDLQICSQCFLKRKVKFSYSKTGQTDAYICDNKCLTTFKSSQTEPVVLSWEERGLRVKNFSTEEKELSPLERKCASCSRKIDDVDYNLTWEIMDFCDEFCLTHYQKEKGSKCSRCGMEVRSNSLGKYCVRFGNDIRQFCKSFCLEEYKRGLKVCPYCQEDMANKKEPVQGAVGDKGIVKDFCSSQCREKYNIMTYNKPLTVEPDIKCSVCKTDNAITINFETDGTCNYFCGDPCFVAYSFVNNISPGKCAMCKKYYPKQILEENNMFYENVQVSFCSTGCRNIYIIAHRKIVRCNWCKVKKYNFDMIRRCGRKKPELNMCSVNCLNSFQLSLNVSNSTKTRCNYCNRYMSAMYNLSMSDGSLRHFCSYYCVIAFQAQFNKQTAQQEPVPTGPPKRSKRLEGDSSQLPVITNVQSLANATNGTALRTRSKNAQAQEVTVQIKQHYIVRPPPAPEQKNMGTMCRVRTGNKSTSAKPSMVSKECQTDDRELEKHLIPIPVPIYVPCPMHMFAAPAPTPVPFPIPVPVPIFIPTTRNSANGIMKEIKKIQVKMPTDPYEAELLMMAEMVAEEKKEDPTDSESDVEDGPGGEESYSPEPVDASNTFGDDMLQMALKMATELDEPAVDLEGALTANTITAPQGAEASSEEQVDDPQPMHHMMERGALRGRKRGMRQSRGGGKRGRRMSNQVDIPLMQQQATGTSSEPIEKPDANMCLKYTFGVNAWKQWVTTKNADLEKSSRRVKLFKTEILQLTADELNYSLCLFVKEVRKPNGAEYAPDTIYYLCLGIQQYLFENGRIDNIFCDPYYEKFTDCLDEVARKFSVLYNDSHYIVTRVEEEHLWESKQLGAHSPHVLLSTLMFFNTKHFNLTSVDEHMQLSFSHIMKHWKRNPNQPGASKLPGSRNVLLRFYPPQSAIQNNAKKKKVYEQQENEENPLRCPVKLYEFYLSKCPESVKTRNDVFYLQPERSCVPDSPVWYSTMPLAREALEKMLHRVKMVKEINVSLLTT